MTQLAEGDVFRTVVPLPAYAFEPRTEPATAQVTPQATGQATGQARREQAVLEFCRTPRSRDEIRTHVGIRDRDHFRTQVLLPRLERGLLVPSVPAKPNRPQQKYLTHEPSDD